VSLPTDSVIAKDWTWIKTHLALLAVVVILAVGSVYFIEKVIADHDHQRAIELQTIAQQISAQNQTIQQQTKAEIDSLTQNNLALQQEIGALATAIATRDFQLQKTQQQVPTLTPDQLSAEWQTRIKNAGKITPTTNGYTADQAAAVATVQALESVPVLEQDKHDLQVSNADLSKQAANSESKYEQELKAHTSDTTACQADLKSAKAQLTDAKAQARKRNIIAAVLGIAGGIILKTVGL